MGDRLERKPYSQLDQRQRDAALKQGIERALLEGGVEIEPGEAPPAWPAPIADAAFHGPAGEFVSIVEPHTEADRVALLAQFLAGFGNLIGRHAYRLADGMRRHSNPVHL